MGDDSSGGRGFYVSPPRLVIANFFVLFLVALLTFQLTISIWRISLFVIGLLLTGAFIYSLVKTHRIPQIRMAPQEVDLLILSGPFATVRHPNFTGILMMNIAFLCFFPTFWLIPFILVFGGIWYHEAKYEEAVLIEKFGDRYEEYKQSTGMFLPKLE
ncbi:MAG: isoprenylcysteine carboxylmethyltransferase family protein [Candidatus Thorarchaeota archaeon]